jgi:Fe-S oxidoreductase
VGRAAVEVLEAAGCRVELPRRTLCCGRPLYDYGMLDLAERFLRQTLDALAPEITEGVPIVVLEPSCAAVFRDELLGLFPNEEDARRLARQTFTLGEFLERELPDWEPPGLEREALFQGHCHQKAVMGFEEERSVLGKLGLDVEYLQAGCCGMAGSFGYEKEKYDVSMRVGERAVLPAVRAADEETLVIADGFSCRSQIAGATDRRAVHLAQALQMGLHNYDAPSGERPVVIGERPPRPDPRIVALAGAALAGGALALMLRKKAAK